MITKSQIYSWDPSTLTDIGSAWNSMGSDIEDLFDRYKSSVANVNGGPWEGMAADAAQTRAESDRAAAIRLVDHLQHVAQIALDGFDQISPPLERARNAISGAEQAGFFVSEDLTVSYFGEMTSSRERAMTDWQQAITYAATDAETADNDVKDALTAAREDLTVAFVSPGSLGSDQARTDANQLLDDPSDLTPEQLQRLIEAGSLTTDQLVALASGDTVNIPASQMEYINALARSLDGKSSQDIEEMLNALPPEAREGMANALQLISTTRVSASVKGDAEIPTNGRANLLPEKMYESLTRDDLLTYDTQTFISGRSAVVYDVVNLNGVAENQAAARIAGMSDITFMHGTGLDAAVLDTAAQYLHGQNAAESDDLFFVDGYGESIDAQITDGMFHAVAEDRAAVADYVSGRDGQRFLSDVFTHEWSDDGQGISELFDISSYDAVADPNNGPDWARATQSGNIAESMARYMSENSDDLLHMPDDTAAAAGERNPHLIRNLAEDLAPYYSTFAGSQTIPGVGHFDTTNELADMYSVLATDAEAGVAAAQATVAQENLLAAVYGAGDGPSTYAQIAGQMQHALESGTMSAWKALDTGDLYAANWEAAVNKGHFDAGRAALEIAAGRIPGVGTVAEAMIKVGGREFAPHILGIVDPTAVTDPGNSVPNETATSVVDSNLIVENIVNGLVGQDPSVINDPALDPYVGTNDNGDPYIEVENLDDQAEIRDHLYAYYGIDVDSWYTNFNTGMHNGTIAVAGR